MKKRVILIIGVLTFCACVIAYVLTEKNTSNGYLITSKTQSMEMLREFNLDKASEDVSYILDEAKLNYPLNSNTIEVYEYKPDPKMDWVISLTKPDSGSFVKNEIDELFDYEWRRNYSSSIYGLSIEDNKWHYANAGDSPSSFSELQVAVNLLEVYNEEDSGFKQLKLKNYIDELNKKRDSHLFKIQINVTEPIENAIERAKELVAYDKEFNQGVTIVLMGETPFDGRITWDALMCLGLEWGDGDLFHWANQNKNYGPDQHFMVWTTTEPGYFLPMSIESGRMNPKNLVFGFGLQGSIDPLKVFDVMYNSVEYCQKRLGGRILDKGLQPFNKLKEKKYIKDLIEKQKVADQGKQ